MNYLIAASRPWFRGFDSHLQERTGQPFVLIQEPEGLSLDRLNELNPRYIFFPHWSHRIPREIFENYECVIFHMTDVPFGRGGSPLQNLIIRGIYDTQISALRCVEEMDAGPIYLKRPFSLQEGSAENLFRQAADLIAEMIEEIVMHQPIPVTQTGEPVVFKRRKPSESDLSDLDDLQKVYDYIRMLDADGYPHAYLETEHMRYEFRQVERQVGKLTAKVTITLK